MSAAVVRSALGTQLRAQPWGYYAGYALGRAAPIAVLPLVAHAVGASGFGRFEVALALVTTAAIIFDAGMGASIVRFARDPRFGRSEVIGAASALQLAAAVVAVAVFAPAAILLAPRGIPAAEVVGIMALFAFVEGYAVIASGILRSDRRDRLFLMLSIVRFAVTAGVGGGLAYAVGTSGALLGVAVGGIGFALFALREWWGSGSTGSGGLRRILLRYGIPLMATTLGMWMLALSDRLFLQYSVSPTELGSYSANYRVGSAVLVFAAAPLALAWIAEAQRTHPAEMERKQREWIWIFSLVALATGLACTLASAVLVHPLFGSSFHPQPGIVALVALSGWFGGLYYLLCTPLLTSDSTRPLAALSLATVVVNLLLNFLLIPSRGALGAAVATALSYGALCAGAVIVSRRVR